MALRTASLNSGKRLPRDFRLLLTPITTLIIIPTLIIFTLATFFPFSSSTASSSAAQTAQAQFAMSTSGAKPT